jgi:phenylalanyl-tRNA synthetase beta chain
LAAIWSAPTQGLLRNAQLFDVYRPKVGKDATLAQVGVDRSLAVRLTLNNDTATLTEEQIEATVRAVIDQLAALVGARQRT